MTDVRHIPFPRIQGNKINGRPLEFGNVEQIEALKVLDRLMSGQYPICEVNWEYVRVGNRTTETGKPITYYVAKPKEADAVQCYIPCPKCTRQHKHVVGYDPSDSCATEMWASIEDVEITCWNCGLEMYIEPDGSRNVYVKKEEDPI